MNFGPRAMFIAVGCFLSAGASLAGTGHPPGFSETPYGGRFTVATSMAWAPDGSNRLFITRQGFPRGTGPTDAGFDPRFAGEIRIIKDGVLLPTPFAVVTPIVNWSECGLIGITIDPAFRDNGYVYVTACVSNTEQQIIRYTAVGDVGTNKTIILANLPSAGDTHNGGGVSIGPDGKLYFAIGDNRNTDGGGPDGDLASLRSKVGRANVDGTLPNDNPYFDGPGPNNDYIWARGMRNPFTHTWQVSKRLMWLNDVGGIADQVFQVNAGQHGGWTQYGGGSQPADGGGYQSNGYAWNYIRPVLTLSSGGPSGMAIAGSTFYDGTLFPPAFRGDYFFGDFEVPGRILRAELNSDNSLNNQSVFVTNASGPLGFQVGPDGALYYLTYDPIEPATTGGVYRITYTDPDPNAPQGIVIDKLHIQASEGNSTVFSVRLAKAPSGPVTVSLSKTGDSDVTLNTSSLSFGVSDWSTPQSVVVSAAQDSDGQADLATVNVSSNGLVAHSVEVYVVDDDAQVIVVSTGLVSMSESSDATFTVRLLKPPTGDVTVTVARSSGDTDVSVVGGTSLLFNSSTYQTPQTVTIRAAHDVDTSTDRATLALTASSPATPAREIIVMVADTDNAAPVITSTANTRAVAGGPYRYDVEATGLPVPTFSLPTSPAGMTINSSTGLIDWVAGDAGTYPVIVQASNGILPVGEQSFNVTVSADMPPSAVLSQPQSGAVVSGFIEFFGDATDDVSVVRAQFYVDDVFLHRRDRQRPFPLRGRERSHDRPL